MQLENTRRAGGESPYYLGSSFRGHALTEVLGQGPRASFIYGDCEPAAGLFEDGGCAPPAQVQNWPLCARNPAILAGPAHPRPLRGALVMPAGGGLDVYTGRTAVVIFGGGRRAVAQLRRVDADRPPRNLPPPNPELMAAKRCHPPGAQMPPP